MILLGQKVKDKVTGFEGIAVSRVEYMNGCIQYGVRPRYIEAEMKGIYPQAEYIDQDELEKLYPEALEDEESAPEEIAFKKVKPRPGGLQSARPKK